MRSTSVTVAVPIATTVLVSGLLVAGGGATAVGGEGAVGDEGAGPAAGERRLGETTVDETAMEQPRALRSGSSARAEIEDGDRDSFDLVGITWADQEASDGLTAQVRVRQDGAWSDWIDIDVGTSEGSGQQRGGTEPVWVGESDGVAARVTGVDGTVPEDIRVVTIDGGPDRDVTAEAPSPRSAGSEVGPAAPSVITRSSWGAASGGTCDSPVHGKLRGVMIHHTAGSNSYSKSESASIVRAIQSYHVGSQGWCDIGYNFLVDKYGQTFEGRKGGWTRMVRGAHAGSSTLNQHLVGISMMGNYETAHTTASQRSAVVRLVAWRLGSKKIPAKGRMTVDGHGLYRISMHTNVSATVCPGRNGVNWVKNPGGLRDRAADAIADAAS